MRRRMTQGNKFCYENDKEVLPKWVPNLIGNVRLSFKF